MARSTLHLIQAALQKGWAFAVVAILISSVLAVFYCYRVLVNLWVAPRPDGASRSVQRVPYMILGPLLVLALMNLVFGVYAEPLVTMAETAAAAAFNAGVAP